MRILSKRRRHENRTNYTKRRRLLEGRKARIVARKTNRYIILQYIESKAAQDTIRASVTSKELLEHGWSKESEGSLKSLGAAYLSGLLLAKKIKGFAPAILDTGLIRSTKGSRIYAAAKGINDGGFVLPCSKEVFPEEKRLENENTKAFFNKVKENIMKGAKK